MNKCPHCGQMHANTNHFCPVTGNAINLGPRLVSVRLLEQFRVVSILGEGPISVVAEVEEIATGQNFAAKLIHPQYSRDPESVQKLFDDIARANELECDQLAKVAKTGRDAGAAITVVRELLSGHTLATRIEQVGQLGLRAALPIAKQILLGLNALHSAEILVLDLSPSGIFLCQTDSGISIKILDVGVQHIKEKLPAETRAGIASFKYCAPEQLDSSGARSLQSDIYSASAIFYEMLTGKLPEKERVPVSAIRDDVPPILSDAVDKGLELEPTRRFSSAWDFIEIVDQITAELDAQKRTSVVPSTAASSVVMTPESTASASQAVSAYDASKMPGDASSLESGPSVSVQVIGSGTGNDSVDSEETAISGAVESVGADNMEDASSQEAEAAEETSVADGHAHTTMDQTDESAEQNALDQPDEAAQQPSPPQPDEAAPAAAAQQPGAQAFQPGGAPGMVPAGAAQPAAVSQPIMATPISATPSMAPAFGPQQTVLGMAPPTVAQQDAQQVVPSQDPPGMADPSAMMNPSMTTGFPSTQPQSTVPSVSPQSMGHFSGAAPTVEDQASVIVEMPEIRNSSFKPIAIAVIVLLSIAAGAGLFYYLDSEAEKAELESQPKTVQITIEVNPQNASIEVDGKEVMGNPWKGEVTQDSRTHNIVAKADGYETKERDIKFSESTKVILELVEIIQPDDSAQSDEDEKVVEPIAGPTMTGVAIHSSEKKDVTTKPAVKPGGLATKSSAKTDGLGKKTMAQTGNSTEKRAVKKTTEHPTVVAPKSKPVKKTKKTKKAGSKKDNSGGFKTSNPFG